MSSDELFPTSPQPSANGTFIANEHLYDIVQWLHDSPVSVIPGTLSGNAQFGETLSSEDALAANFSSGPSGNQIPEHATAAAAVPSTTLTEHGRITCSTTEERDSCVIRTKATTTGVEKITKALDDRSETALPSSEADEIPWNDIQGERKKITRDTETLRNFFLFFISFFLSFF